MSHENFSINLRTLSNNQISVAHICRKMEINRQQFNKYLSGQIYPSKYNLNKICQYFQFSEEELNLKPSEFGLIASKSPQLESNPGKIKLNNTIDSISSLEVVGNERDICRIVLSWYLLVLKISPNLYPCHNVL